ncbi:MAG: cyanophycinase [Spirochaetia bacterium]|nr:cyanophycinase [Spirochaetia bacterium]
MLKPNFKGRLIAIGGNEDKVNNLVVLKRVVQEIGKSAYKVVVVTTASEVPEQRGKEYSKIFTDLGAYEVETLDIQQRFEANDPNNLSKLENVDLIFFVGGDQLRLTTIVGGSKVLSSIKSHLEAGALIAGTSAGAAAFADVMIYEGKSEEALIKGKVLTTAGFGFVENVIFDTHFMARGRIGRLIQIVSTNPACIGVGIGEDSGVILKGEGTVEVIGSGQIIIVDGSHIGHSNMMKIEPGASIAVENIIIHSLVNGYQYDFKNRLFISPPQKGKQI